MAQEKTAFFEKKFKDTVIEKQVKRIDSLVNSIDHLVDHLKDCLLYTSPSPRD